jgi:hypothetical protein
MSADGPEARESERLERATPDHDTLAARADESRDELRDLMLAIARPSCSLIGHDRHPTKGYCRFCGISLP